VQYEPGVHLPPGSAGPQETHVRADRRASPQACSARLRLINARATRCVAGHRRHSAS